MLTRRFHPAFINPDGEATVPLSPAGAIRAYALTCAALQGTDMPVHDLLALRRRRAVFLIEASLSLTERKS